MPAAEHRLRVLMIASGIEGGGAHRSPRELFHALRGLGIDCRLFLPSRKPNFPPQVQAIRFAGERFLGVVDVAYAVPPDWRHIGSIVRLGRLSRRDFDVVHLHNLHSDWISLAAVRRLSRRIPTVWTFHDEWPVTPGIIYDVRRVLSAERERELFGRLLDFPDPAHQPYKGYMRQARRHLPQPAAIICPSQYLATMAQECGLYPGVEVHRIPYPLTMQRLAESQMPREEARRSLRLPMEGKVVLLIAAGLHSPFKGIELGIAALNQLPADAATVLVVGSGVQGLERKLRLPVVQTGFLESDAALAAAYRAVDVAVLPSVADNFPYVGLEAMSCEVPLATFKIGGFAEMVGNSERGLSAEPFDVTQLARNIQQLLEDPAQAAALGSAGRRWVGAQCDPSDTVQKTIDVYRSVMRSQ